MLRILIKLNAFYLTHFFLSKSDFQRKKKQKRKGEDDTTRCTSTSCSCAR